MNKLKEFFATKCLYFCFYIYTLMSKQRQKKIIILIDHYLNNKDRVAHVYLLIEICSYYYFFSDAFVFTFLDYTKKNSFSRKK
jgi:hypothetical protein